MRARGRFRLSHRITNAAASERIAFHPAIEMPRNDHCTSSQRTSGAAMIGLKKSSADAAADGAVHWVKPSQ